MPFLTGCRLASRVAWLTTTLEKGGRGALWRSLLDLVLAVLSLVLLALTATAALQCLNLLSLSGGGVQIYDLIGLLAKLRNPHLDPSVWWVYFTLFSTFLPTIVHGYAGVWSLLGWTFSKKERQQFIKDIGDDEAIGAAIGEGNHMASIKIARAFAFRDVLAWLLTGFGAILLLSLLLWGLPGLSRALLFACETLAQILGADIIPGKALPLISPTIKQWLI